MLTSTKWINDYLDPRATADEQGELLTRAGFPLEGRDELQGDTQQDFEMTSNRGDCVCHVGLAREIAAISGRNLNTHQPKSKPTGPTAAELITVTNREPSHCPLYTARVIRGVKVSPSPDWIAERLRAIGQIPRNNIVDATNFVLFELGQPAHVFDLAQLNGSKIIIRKAKSNEPFLPIGEGEAEVKLSKDDLVIADGDRAVALAGVKGGALTAVTESTTDILIEAATFNPPTVRNTSRRLHIASDSSYRFERGVHPAAVNPATERVVELLLETAGGELCEGVVADGADMPDPLKVSIRPARCQQIIGVELDEQTMIESLRQLGFEPKLRDNEIDCTVPPHRMDIHREIDLIEEVARMFGHDQIPIAETIPIRVAPPQATEQAQRAVHNELVGMGFVETVTHSLVGESEAKVFLPPDMQLLRVDDERARATPALRPSMLPSLLTVFAFNHDHGMTEAKLFESGATFARHDRGHLETDNLAFVLPIDNPDSPLRFALGAIDRLVELLLGPEAEVTIEQSTFLNWFEPGAVLRVNDTVLGTIGVMRREISRRFGLEEDLVAAELGLPALYENFPPEIEAHALPSFPAIQRDISAIVDEQVTWQQVLEQIESLSLEMLESIEFVTTYRGRQIERGKKSLSLRLRFRAADRTLVHDEVDSQINQVIETLQRSFDAELRQ